MREIKEEVKEEAKKEVKLGDAELSQQEVVQEEVEKRLELNEESIKIWKSQHGKVFRTIIGDEVFIWRKLKRKEYVSIMSTASEVDTNTRIYERQEMIVSNAIIFPYNINEVIESDAGVATCLADEIILKSGFEVISTEEL